MSGRPACGQRSDRKVILAYEDESRGSSATAVRVFDAARALSEHRQVAVRPLSALGSVSGRTILVVKPKDYWSLGPVLGRGNRVLVDVLDGTCSLESADRSLLAEVDGGLFCSLSALSEYGSLFKGGRHGMSTTIYHPWDERMRVLRDGMPLCGVLRTGYFGYQGKGHLVPGLPGVDMVPILAHSDMSDPCRLFGGYSAHYVIKPESRRHIFEPLTKVAVAAAAGCPVLALRGSAEAAELLGPDYPYLSDSHSEDDILHTLELMRDTHGCSEWVYALSVMESVRSATDPSVSAVRLHEWLCR